MTRPANSAGDLFQKLLDDAEFLVELISTTIEWERTQVVEQLIRELDTPGSTVRTEMIRLGIPFYTWSDRLIEFYETTNSFFFETLIWNRCGLKHQMRQWIVDYLDRHGLANQNILVFGDGLGFDSLYFQLHGHRVTSYEVSHRSREFAGSVFRRLEADVTIADSLKPVDGFDAVVSLDVLEHVPVPVRTVRQLSGQITDSGLLFIHAPFWHINREVPTHLRTNRRFSGDVGRLYRANGLIPIDAAFFWNPIVLRKSNSNSSFPRNRFWPKQLGGLMLKIGRYFAVPHDLIRRALDAANRKDWPELRSLHEQRADRTAA